MGFSSKRSLYFLLIEVKFLAKNFLYPRVGFSTQDLEGDAIPQCTLSCLWSNIF